jgi:hypothetical protein
MRKISTCFCVFLTYSVYSAGQEKSLNFGAFQITNKQINSFRSVLNISNNRLIFSDTVDLAEGRYKKFDTIFLSEKRIAFIYSFAMEDHTEIGMIAKGRNRHDRYKNYNIAIVLDPTTYNDVVLTDKEKILPFLLIDSRKRGHKDIVTNVIEKNGNHYGIKRVSDTISFETLKNIAAGKKYKVTSKAIFLSTPDPNKSNKAK